MNNNVQALRMLYEAGFDQLHELIRGVNLNNGTFGNPIDHIKRQTEWIHEIGKTLVLVSQIENLRKSDPSPANNNKVKTINLTNPSGGLSDFNPPQPPQIKRHNG